MDNLTPLTRPLQSQVTIEPIAKDCPSEGFNFPTFPQLNKQARVQFSQPFNPTPSTSYRIFATANIKGWFVAVIAGSSSSSELIFSPLEHLRSAFTAAKEEHQELFAPKRALPLAFGKANIVTFTCYDTRLLVGLEQGAIAIYDTAALLTPGSGDVQPLKITQFQSGPLRQIVPNPGIEQNFSSLVVAVGDGKVGLLDMQLEPQGGWTASDSLTQPIAVAWSPKGKHLAIGLQTGDILTFSLSSKSAPHKHIPPTADAILVSLNWLGPGHTFRTSYSAQGDAPPRQHIITLDTKSSTATYIAPDHPFPSFDRNQQSAYILCLPRWDEDTSGEGNKSLTVVGDASSVDLEVLGNIGNEWHRQSQENPLSLPLDKSMDDTMLLALDVDLMDTNTGTPVMYAYLNDGTLQGWQVKHSKPYIGMVSVRGSVQSQDPGSKDSDMGGLPSTINTSPFAQLSGSDTPFGRQTTSSFGQQQSNTFGQSPFGQQPPQNSPVFGQSGFGQLTPSDSPSGFSSPSASGPFSQAGQTNTAASSFGSSAVKPSPGFGASGNVSSGIFGAGSSSGGAFSNLNSGVTNVFGQGSFGANNINSDGASPSYSSHMTREASMSDSTDGFGGMSLGSATSTNSNGVNSMFGEFAAAPGAAPIQSAFGGMVQPATGFGAFNNLKPNNSFEPNKPATASTFSAAPQASTSSGFGQSGFASPTFGKSSFGQPTFGKPGLGVTPSTSASGFAAFANTPATFGSPPKSSVFGSPETKAVSSGVASAFSAFASSAPTTFGSALEASKSADGNKDSGGVFSAFVSSAPTTFASALRAVNISNPSGGGFSAFVAATPAVFGTTPIASTTLENTPKASASAGGFASFASSSPTTFTTPMKASEGATKTSVFGTPTGSKSFSSTTESPFASPTIRSAPFGDLALTRNTANTPGGSPQTAFAISPPSSPEPGLQASSPPYANNNTPSTPRVPPAPSSNAFSNIQATPSAFKPAAGFGAFGSAVTPPTSPFFKKPDDKPPVSAFSNFLPQAKSPATPVSTVTFGSSSALGGPKSVFAPVSPPSPTVLKPTTSDGFGAFSGSTGGFSAFAGPKKSFSELLKTGDADPVNPSTSLSYSVPPLKDLPEETTTPKAITSTSGLPSMSSDSSSMKHDNKDDKPRTPKSAFSVLSAPSPGKESVDKVYKGKGKSDAAVSNDDDKKVLSTNEVVSSGTIPDEPSYGIISGSSATSSFVDIKVDQGSDGDAEEDAGDDGDEVNAFLSEDASSDGSYEDQESAEESSAAEDSEARDSPPREPAAVPLPMSRSPSATPQPEVPTIEISPSPPSEEKFSRSSSLSPAREPSTTPPGTPAGESKPLIGSSPISSNAPIPSSFGIGLGRPSTRPTRSSPLANTVLSGHDEEEEDKANLRQPPTVAPKSVFNTLPVKVERESSEGQSPTDRRPKTPPLLSTIGETSSFASASSSDASKPSTVPAESSFAEVNAPVSLPFSFQKPAAMTSLPSVFWKPPQALSLGPSPSPPMPGIHRPASAPAPTHPTFFGTSPPASVNSSPSASVFNVPPVNPQILTTTISSTSALQGPVVTKPLVQIPTKGTSGAPPSMGLPSFFAAPSQPASFPQNTTLKAPPADLFAASPAFSVPRRPPAATAAQVALEEGMQKECIHSVALANKELEEMTAVVNGARKKFEEVGTSRGGLRDRRDLSDPIKWGLSDLAQFGQVLLQYEEELDNLAAQSETKKQALREIQSSMLRAGTRREEIARFNRAKTDQEFAKILKARTLGPEHSETQIQLRKYIRLVHDRVQKLETGLQEKKKKLAESISGKPGFKAPSLDTINRSYQNIDRIIREKSDQVSDLTGRISKLNARDVAASPQRDVRLGNSGSGRPHNVTPDVAVTTAAALNAERSAQRLKKALLAVRKKPLLNTKAASAPNMLLNTPQKLSNQLSAFPALLPPSPTSSSLASMLDWTSLPEDNFNPNASPLPQSRRGGGGGGQRKHSSVPLKRSGGPSEASASTPIAPSFDWGPLPTFPSPGTAKTTMPTAFVPISAAFKTPPKK